MRAFLREGGGREGGGKRFIRLIKNILSWYHIRWVYITTHYSTWASNSLCDLMVPGAHSTIPRLTSSLLVPLSNAPKVSPASPLSRSLWNISIPETQEANMFTLSVWHQGKAVSYLNSWLQHMLKLINPKLIYEGNSFQKEAHVCFSF